MALSKVTYTDNQTVIGAANLNAIQDEIIAIENDNYVDTARSTSSTSPLQNKVVDAALTAIENNIDAIEADINRLDDAYITDTASGGVAHIIDGADDMPLKNLEIEIKATQSGTGDPSPSNVRPIIGRTQAKLTQCGKNLFDPNNADWKNNYLINSSGNEESNALYRYTQGFFRVKPNTTYTVSLNKTSSASYACTVPCYDINKEFIPDSRQSAFSVTSSSGIKFGTITTPANCCYIRISTGASTSNFQIEEGSSYTGYEAYNGQTYTINFPSAAGNVYGGSITWNGDGTWTVKSEWGWITTANNEGQLTRWDGASPGWSGNASAYAYFAISGDTTTVVGSGNGICNMYVTKSTVSGLADPSVAMYNSSNNARLAIRDSDIPGWSSASSGTDYANAAKAYLGSLHEAGTPFFAVFKLVNPVEYTVTNDSVIMTLLGINNFFADTGDTTVEYRADTKLYIQKLTQPTEDDMTANENIATNTFFMVGNNLYISTAAILTGETITPGTNCTQLSLAQALNQLNA